jgi:hypothetical protein
LGNVEGGNLKRQDPGRSCRSFSISLCWGKTGRYWGIFLLTYYMLYVIFRRF